MANPYSRATPLVVDLARPDRRPFSENVLNFCSAIMAAGEEILSTRPIPGGIEVSHRWAGAGADPSLDPIITTLFDGSDPSLDPAIASAFAPVSLQAAVPSSLEVYN